MAVSARSMSSSSVSRDREKRTAPSFAAIGAFIAFSTCEAACEPAEQAAPVETAIALARQHRRDRLGLDAGADDRAGVGQTLRARPERSDVADAPDEAAFEPVAQGAHSGRVALAGAGAAISAALPKPTTPGTFSVPPRRARSCLPP